MSSKDSTTWVSNGERTEPPVRRQGLVFIDEKVKKKKGKKDAPNPESAYRTSGRN